MSEILFSEKLHNSFLKTKVPTLSYKMSKKLLSYIKVTKLTHLHTPMGNFLALFFFFALLLLYFSSLKRER